MHIPDGFLTHGVAAFMGGAALATTIYSAKRSFGQVPRTRIPLLAATAALVFAGQMVNFPIAGGTSGHFLGAVFAAILFGPFLANILFTVILALQMLLFQDGGLLALGANACNMAVIGTFGGYWIYRMLKDLVGGANGILVGAFVAGWFSVVLSATACALEMGFSGIFSPLPLLGAMLGVHIKIGVAEGLLTLALAAMLMRMKPSVDQIGQGGLLASEDGKAPRQKLRVLSALALLVVVAGTPFSSLSPDGLERVATDLGFIDKGDLAFFAAPLPDYRLPGVDNEVFSVIIAGLLGVVILFCVVAAIGMLLGARRTTTAPPEAVGSPKVNRRQERIIHAIIIPYLLVFAVVVSLLVDGLTTSLHNRIDSLIGEEAGDALDQAFFYLQGRNEHFLGNVAGLGKLPELADALAGGDRKQVQAMVRHFQTENPQTVVRVIDAEGDPEGFASVHDDVRHDPSWREAAILVNQGKERFGYRFVGKELVSVAVVPVRAAERIVGGVVAILPWDEEECRVIRGLTGSDVFLFRADQLLATSMAAEKGTEVRVSIPSSVWEQVLASGARHTAHFFIGQNHLVGAFAPLKGEDGSTIGMLMASRNGAPLRAIILGMIKAALFYSLVGLGAIALISLFVARGITDPLRRLAAVTARVTAGDLNAHVEINRQNEIGDLAASFNHMTDQLRVASGQLLAAKEYSENILRSMAEALIIVGVDGRIVGINDATTRLLGYRQEELAGQPLDRLVADERRSDLVDDFIQKALAGVAVVDWEIGLHASDGKVIPVSVCVAGLKNGAGDRGDIIMSARDMRDNQRVIELSLTTDHLRQEIVERQKAESELRFSQAQLIQTSKLAAIGELASGIAHELNQPLMVIRSKNQLMQQRLRKNTLTPEHMADAIEMVDRNTKRMMNIINHLRAFSRQSGKSGQSDLTQELMQINKVIDDCFLLMGEQLRLRDIQIKKEFDPDLPKIKADGNRLEQVFLNLLGNARDAVMEKREKCEDKENYQPEITIHTTTSDDKSHLVILISDNGCGIPSGMENTIFDPFVTSKEVGKGTGLGLSISYGIIKEHNGRLRVAKSSAEGTTFSVELPVV
jgi:cobalamin biosynthesis protein CbiM